MNTSTLKTFAPAVRLQLMEVVTRKLDYVLTAQTPDYIVTFKTQVDKLRKLNNESRDVLIEHVAYTWFNRLTALRYLDARRWHPFGARVLMPATPDESEPEILKLMRSGALPQELRNATDVQRLDDLLDGRIPTARESIDAPGEVYRHLVLAACRFYHGFLPELFEDIDDETELLLPDDLLTTHSVAQGFRDFITNEDCQEVEVLGWLYQFYISEKKDEVMARKKAVLTDDIPAVTQLFTPDWIVRYLVENSLGRLWMKNRPQSRLRENMQYYIEGDPGHKSTFVPIERPEDIRLLDPAVGSGHMLVYAFDLLHAIYEEEGYAPSEIPGLILQHNLYGLDICPRAVQLAQMALVFKAREKARRFFTRAQQPHIRLIEDVHFEENELTEYAGAVGHDLFSAPLLNTLQQFEHGSTFGSLIRPEIADAADALKLLEEKQIAQNLFLLPTHEKVLSVLRQADFLGRKYHVVVANPPYMGGKGMNGLLKDFLATNFKDVKSDLFAAFIVRNTELAIEGGQLGFMTPFVWMFISSYEKLRTFIIDQKTITSLIQLEYSGFEGATVPICTFTLENRHNPTFKGSYIRLSDFKGAANQGPKALEIIQSYQEHLKTNI